MATKTLKSRRVRWSAIGDHTVLIIGAILMLAPPLLAFVTASHDAVTIHRDGIQTTFGDHLGENFNKAMFEKGGFTQTVDGTLMLMNSLILGIGFAVGKIIISMKSHG